MSVDMTIKVIVAALFVFSVDVLSAPVGRTWTPSETLTCNNGVTEREFTGVCPSSGWAIGELMQGDIDYSVVYVRYPSADPSDPYVTIPQGEDAYNIRAGADLMLFKPDGSEEVLVDCTDCSVMDPNISFDGRYVYYSRIDNIPATPTYDSQVATGGFIYKIDLQAAAPRPQIQLTFDDGYECDQYAGNGAFDMEASYRKLRDMAPFPMAGGKVGFTSNRSCIVGYGNGAEASFKKSGSVQQIYVIDDHDGSLNTAALSNMHRLENGSIRMVQHPMQLKDGRILFSTWQDVAQKYDYAMTSLFTINPDGSNMMQFTEPHDHHKNLDHFITQLANEDVVWGNYYPSFDYGFGVLLRAPINPTGPDWVRQPVRADSFREMERKNETSITPHTTPQDVPAPEVNGVASGKYAMPSVAKGGHMLTAWSSGYVNFFDAACGSAGKCDALKSGIYLILDAQTQVINDPAELSKMIRIKDDPNYNEIWPRAVVSYQDIYGIPEPLTPANSVYDAPQDSRLADAEPHAIVGTSSMLHVDDSDNQHSFAPSINRETHDGNWTIQGAEAGVFTDADVYAVRIVATPTIPYTHQLIGADKTAIDRYLKDDRRDSVPERFGSAVDEQWKILGEFILPHTASTDSLGDKDTSWAAKIPAEMPFLIQTLDQNGMTINSELTWRALKSGEKRVDCGGCHVHTKEPLSYATTQSGLQSAIAGIAGLLDNDPKIQNGLYDLTDGAPLLDSTGMSFSAEKLVEVEFNDDIQPIITNRCVACHTDGQTNGGLVLDGTGENDAYGVLAAKDGAYKFPQRNKYVRIPQARESLLIWNIYNQRLDGRLNADRGDDLDFTSHPAITGLTDTEKRTFARWVDMGVPIDFPVTSGFGYTEDSTLPVIQILDPKRGTSPSTGGTITVGLTDAESDIDLATFSARYAQVTGSTQGSWVAIDTTGFTLSSTGLGTITEPPVSQYVLEITVDDTAGNTAIHTQHVTKQ